jgi:predicted DNA-binding transcriptional regulator AlpA
MRRSRSVGLMSAAPPLELVGVSEIAELLGVSRQAAHELTGRSEVNDFPPPYGVVVGAATCRRYWLPEEVDEWISNRRRRRPNNGGTDGTDV